MTRGEAVTWLRKYKQGIPKFNFRHGNLMRNPEFLFSSRALFTADELIFRIQNEDRDPLEVVKDWCKLMDVTLTDIDVYHPISLQYAGMMEYIGRDILRCMRAEDNKLACKPQIGRKIASEDKRNHR